MRFPGCVQVQVAAAPSQITNGNEAWVFIAVTFIHSLLGWFLMLGRLITNFRGLARAELLTGDATPHESGT